VRKNVVFGILLGLLALFGIATALRGKKAHVPPAAPSALASASASTAASTPPPPTAAQPDKPSAAKKLGRTLRVTSLGWELVAPLVLQNGGLSTKKGSELEKADVSVSIAIEDEMKNIESAFARGGGDEKGADLAIVPLPNLVLAYDRLRALSPAVLFVTGWSRGREVLAGKDTLDSLPATGDVGLRSGGGDAALGFSLFALELAGIAPARVKLADPNEKPKLAALDRDDLKPGDQTEILLSTADAGRFVPFVMIAPSSFVEREQPTLGILVKSWLAGVSKLDSDPTASARTIGALPGAPEPLALLGRLGTLAPVGLAENAELLGLSGRGALSVEAVFARTWRLMREAKLSNAQLPERAPVAPAVVAALVRSEPALAKPDAAPKTPNTKPKAKPGKALVVSRIEGDDDDVAREIAFELGVFPRARARLTTHKRTTTKTMLETLTGRYGLDGQRIEAGRAEAKGRAAATLEILPVP
jgi:hypothetical protein